MKSKRNEFRSARSEFIEVHPEPLWEIPGHWPPHRSLFHQRITSLAIVAALVISVLWWQERSGATALRTALFKSEELRTKAHESFRAALLAQSRLQRQPQHNWSPLVVPSRNVMHVPANTSSRLLVRDCGSREWTEFESDEDSIQIGVLTFSLYPIEGKAAARVEAEDAKIKISRGSTKAGERVFVVETPDNYEGCLQFSQGTTMWSSLNGRPWDKNQVVSFSRSLAMLREQSKFYRQQIELLENELSAHKEQLQQLDEARQRTAATNRVITSLEFGLSHDFHRGELTTPADVDETQQ